MVLPPADPPSDGHDDNGGREPNRYWSDGLCKIMVSWASAEGQPNTIAIERVGKFTRFIHRRHNGEIFFRGIWVATRDLPNAMTRKTRNSLPYRTHVEERVISYREALAHAKAHGDLDGMKHRLALLEWKPESEQRQQKPATFTTQIIYRDCGSADKHDGTGVAVLRLVTGVN